MGAHSDAFYEAVVELKKLKAAEERDTEAKKDVRVVYAATLKEWKEGGSCVKSWEGRDDDWKQSHCHLLGKCDGKINKEKDKIKLKSTSFTHERLGVGGKENKQKDKLSDSDSEDEWNLIMV